MSSIEVNLKTQATTEKLETKTLTDNDDFFDETSIDIFGKLVAKFGRVGALEHASNILLLRGTDQEHEWMRVPDIADRKRIAKCIKRIPRPTKEDPDNHAYEIKTRYGVIKDPDGKILSKMLYIAVDIASIHSLAVLHSLIY